MRLVRTTATLCLGVSSVGFVLALPATASSGEVVVERGNPVQIAVVLDHSGSLSVQGASARNAIQMAVERHPHIRGFAIQLNDFDGPCHDPATNAAVAAQVVANSANVAVIGHMCSPEERAVLPTYEQAGMVTISGTATNPTNPSFGPDVFNSLLVPDDMPGGSDQWYARVQQLPRDLSWQAEYQARFGSAPTTWADLYFDAMSLLVHEIAAVATVRHGALVIDRSGLASAVRRIAHSSDRGFKGVTCWIILDSRGYRVNDPASLNRCSGESGRVVETDAFSIAWSATDPEEIESLVWRGASMTNTGTVGGLPPGCHFAEYFGNSWTVAHYPFMLVGDSVGTWKRSGPTVRISSTSTGCEGSTGVPVTTAYRFFDDGAFANSFQVERTFFFGSAPADYGLRPYIPRLFPRDAYGQVVHPDAAGTSLVTDSISPCEFGCDVANWNGTWFAANDGVTGRGVIVIRESASPADLWIDMDGASNTAASSAMLKRPVGGFMGTVVEREVLCFYDATSWPASVRGVSSLPQGCSAV